MESLDGSVTLKHSFRRLVTESVPCCHGAIRSPGQPGTVDIAKQPGGRAEDNREKEAPHLGQIRLARFSCPSAIARDDLPTWQGVTAKRKLARRSHTHFYDAAPLGKSLSERWLRGIAAGGKLFPSPERWPAPDV